MKLLFKSCVFSGRIFFNLISLRWKKNRCLVGSTNKGQVMTSSIFTKMFVCMGVLCGRCAMRVNLMTIWSAIFVLLGVHSVWTRHLPWIIYPSPRPFCPGGDEFRNICLSPYPPYWYHSLSPFACLWRPCYWETVADLNKSDDLPVRHYQTRRINSKVMHLTICSNFWANHFRDIELIINNLFPNSWINTTFNCLW